MLDKVQELTHSQYTHNIANYLLSNPRFTSVSFREGSGVPKPSAARILRVLSDNHVVEIIRESGGRRPALYTFSPLIEIVR